MTRAEIEQEIRTALGLVPLMFQEMPDAMLESEWASFKNFQISDKTAISNKHKQLIGLAVAGATRCRYCTYFHTEAARLFGATEQEIKEAALMAKDTMGWSTYLNTRQFDYDTFKEEFDDVTAYLRKGGAAKK